MSKRLGPKLTLVASCHDCHHERTQHYETYDGPCSSYDCMHPSIGPKRINYGGTPDWCPLFDAAVAELIAARRAAYEVVPPGNGEGA